MPSLISLTFDDGLRCQFDKAIPILDANVIPATFFLIADNKPTHENHANEWSKINWCAEDIGRLKAAIEKGHEIGSHSVSHDGNKMRHEQDNETRESKRLNWQSAAIQMSWRFLLLARLGSACVTDMTVSS
jgi:peptidoglycan/xylan/chitin deacetylase (PgdA/CDA1 family)